MKHGKVVAISLLSLLVGAVVGYLGGHNPPPASPRAPEAAKDGAAPTGQHDNDRKANDAAGDNAAAGTPGPGPDAPTRPSGDPLAAFLATLKDNIPTPGMGRIWGRVAFEDGTPAAGAKITASATKEREDYYSPEPGLEDYVRRMAADYHFMEKGTVETVTDADGKYEFGGLGSYLFRLNGQLDGHRLFQANEGGNWRGIKPDKEVNFVAQKICELELDVRLPDGTQAKTAEVSFFRDGGRSTSTWHSRQPRFQVEAGTHTVEVTSGDYRQFASDKLQWTFKLGDPVQKLAVQLVARPGIRCKLELPDGYRRDRWGGGVTVQIVKDPPAEPPAAETRRESRYSPNWDDDYQVFSGLEPGRYRLVVRNGAEALVWKDVTLGQEFLELTLTVPEPAVNDHLVARVYAPDGSLLRNAQVEAQVTTAAGGRHGRSSLVVLKRADDSHWIRRFVPGPADDSQAQVTYKITASHNDYGSTSLDWPDDAGGEVSLRFVEPARLTIQLTGVTSADQRTKLRFSLSREVEPGSWHGTNPDGASHDDGLPANDQLFYSKLTPGRYRFTLSVTSGDPDESFFDRAEIGVWDFDVASGSSTQTCPVPKYYTLTLLVPDPKAASRIGLRSADGKVNRHARRETTARMTYPGITAGEWIFASDNGEMRIVVSGDTEVTLAVKAFDCLSISGIKPGKQIEAMGLRNGDLLVAVDGERPETAELLQVKVQAAMDKEASVWTVIRGGVEQTVTVNGKELFRLMRLTGDERERAILRPSTRP